MKRLPFFALILMCLCSALATGAGPVQRRVVVLIVGEVSLSDLACSDLPNFAWAMENGATALMNARTGGSFNADNAFVTLGAGSRAVGSPKSCAAYQVSELLENGTAGQVYERNTGYTAYPGNLVLPGIAAIQSANAGDDRTIVPGLLGTALHQAGLKTCALGNSDIPGRPGRQSVSMVMDERGMVDMGSVNASLLCDDRDWPYGLRTDYRALLGAYDRYSQDASLISIDLGDVSRVDSYSDSLGGPRWTELRHKALISADGFLGELRARLDTMRTLLLIVSPFPNERAGNSPLCPIIAVGPDFDRPRLTSATTEWPGLVTNMDVAPTIMSFLGLGIPAGVSGRILTGCEGSGDLDGLLRQDARITAADRWLRPVIRFYNVALDVIYAVTALFLLWPGLPGAGWVRALLLFAAGFPLVLLLAPLMQEPAYTLAWLVCLSAAVTVVLLAISRKGTLPLLLLFAGTSLAIALDQLCGAPLAHFSILSYSPVTGARFYGIGNEYMGVLIGSAIACAGIAYAYRGGRRWIPPLTVLCFLGLLVVLGAPALGTNIGGTLAGVVGFGLAAMLLEEKHLTLRSVAIVAGAVAAAIVLLWLFNAWQPVGSQTHLGRLIQLIRQSGAGELRRVAERKLATNLKLIKNSGWSRVVLFSLLSVAITAWFPRGRGRDFARRHKCAFRSILACLAAAAAALVLNDSGIVAAGTLLVYPVTTWFYLLLADRELSEGARGHA